ncbi:MAG: (S)-ureidoglycine aminohydrolase [Eubacteriales bacterium]|nr:(S)-ureidoglycine aminohydrolase [Eubacteriales bacterium]
MSYLNKVTGYREDLLANRSVVKKDLYAIIEPDGIVKNTIPGFEKCDMTILGTPKLGASFVDYLITCHPGGGNQEGFGGEGIQTFFYIFNGKVRVKTDGVEEVIGDTGYIYTAPGNKLYFENIGDEPAFGFLYKRRYQELEGHFPHNVVGHAKDIPWVEYEGMKDVLVKDFLPSAENLGFDMNFHILSFEPGASHGYIETHYQEHGAYIYSGQGMYNLDNEWFPVKKGDYIFMGSYCLQAAYAVGRDEPLAYIYSKDCNRDVEI